MADKTVLRGSLLKYKSWLKWSSKNFVLTQETLSWNTLSTRREGCIHVKNIRLENPSSGGVVFNVINTASNTTIYLKAPSPEEKETWVQEISRVIGSVIQFGVLKKWTNILKGWQLRYFILYDDRLCYYLSEETLAMRRGTIYLSSDRGIGISDSNATHGFNLSSLRGNTCWYLKATCQEDMDKWKNKLASFSVVAKKESVETSSQVQPSAPPLPSSRESSIADEDSDVETSYRKDLECVICLDVLHEPTTLTCGHSFCRNCLADLWHTDPSHFMCPACRQAVERVPSVNIALQNLIKVLYENEGEPRERSVNREAFENFGSGQSPSPAPTNVRSGRGGGRGGGGGARVGGNLEFEFLKRGMCLIFVLWIGSKITSSLISDSASRELEEEKGVNLSEEITSGIWSQLDSRNTLIFLMTGLLQAPRLLGLYIILFWHSSVFQPIVQVISNVIGQSMGVGFQVKVVIWGVAVPYIWLIPVFLYHEQYLLAAASTALTIIELWQLFFHVRQFINIHRDHQYMFIINLLKREGIVSLLRLAISRVVSFLPWTWLPDVLYYCALLYLTAEVLSQNINKVKNLLERTRALRLTIPPGVRINTVQIRTD